MPVELVRALQQNHVAVDAIVAALNVLASVVIVVAGPIAALAFVLEGLSKGCNVEATFQSECKQAALGCTIAAVACAIATPLSLLSVAGAPAAIAIAPLGIVFAALAPIFNAMGDGKTPKLSDMGGALTALGGVGGLDLGSVSGVFSDLGKNAPLVNQLTNNATVKAALSQAIGAHTADAKAQALASAKAKSAATTKACLDAGGHYDPSNPLADAHGCVTPHATALAGAKAKSAATTQACIDSGGHYDPSNPHADAHGCVHGAAAPGAVAVVGAVKKKKTIPTAGGGVVGAVVGFVAGGPVGAAVGGALGAFVGNKVGGRA